MSRRLLLFVVVPAVELVRRCAAARGRLLLIVIGRRIGTRTTLGLIVATGALGACLARGQVAPASERCRGRRS